MSSISYILSNNFAADLELAALILTCELWKSFIGVCNGRLDVSHLFTHIF